MLRLGIVGLPNVGKSTLFNAITRAGAAVANYPFCTIEPNVGVVAVPDERLQWLAALHHPEKVTPAHIEFVDIAGLVRGASRGEGLGNRFLSHIREVDAIVHVVRCFDDTDIVHVDGATDPVRDIETIHLELVLSDLEFLDRRIEKLRKASKSGEARILEELETLGRLRVHLDAGRTARSFPERDDPAVSELPMLSSKPVLYAANVPEPEAAGSHSPYVEAVRRVAEEENAEMLVISARIEEELSQLDADERALFLAEMGLPDSGLDRMIRAGYHLLGLVSFLTAGPTEVRAWTIPAGTRAPAAAGSIHSDFERGFIRAEVVAFHDLKACGTMAAAREKGLVRSEGRDYVMQDGDVVLFRFNV